MDNNSLPKNRFIEEKWTKELTDVGWTAIPNVIFERQKALKLKPIDINIILHLASYWYRAEKSPYPSKVSIANAIDVTPRTVQRRIAKLEKDGLIVREERRIIGKGSDTNIYHFSGLIKAAKPYAYEKMEENKKHRKETMERIKRKSPLKKDI